MKLLLTKTENDVSINKNSSNLGKADVETTKMENFCLKGAVFW